MMEWFDVAILATLILAAPIWAIVCHRDLLRLQAEGDKRARLIDYRTTMVGEWSVTVAVLLFWFAVGRTGEDLGFAAPAGWGFWLGLGAAAAIGLGLMWQEVNIRRKPELQEEARRQIGEFEELAPHTPRELKTFSAVSVTAGICEEILYRGYLMWLLTATAGVWAAVLGSSLIFAAGHLYQGIGGALRTFLTGLVLAGLYLLTGSLWVPILLHAVVDLSMGRLAYFVLTEPRSPSATLPSTA